MVGTGEKFETIILTRKSGAYGQWLGETSEVFGAARVDGLTFKARRGVEIGSPAWSVLCVETGETIETAEQFELPLIVDQLARNARRLIGAEAPATPL